MSSKPLRRAPTTDALVNRIKGLLGRQLDELDAHYDANEAGRAAASGPAPSPPAAPPRPYPRRRDR